MDKEWCGKNGICACGVNLCARIYWFSFLIISLLIIFFSVYFAGYKPNVGDWNNNAVETTCIVDKIYTIPAATYGTYAKYSFSCNCISDCSSGQCVTICSTCFDHYHNGWIDVTYEKNHTKSVMVYFFGPHHEADPNKIIETVSATYPVNKTLPCYYQKNNIEDFKLLWDYGLQYLIPAWLMIGFIGIIIITWITLDVIRYYRIRSKIPASMEVENPSSELSTKSVEDLN